MNWKTYRRCRKGLFLLVIAFVFLSVCVRVYEHTNLARLAVRKRVHRDGDPANITRSLEDFDPGTQLEPENEDVTVIIDETCNGTQSCKGNGSYSETGDHLTATHNIEAESVKMKDNGTEVDGRVDKLTVGTVGTEEVAKKEEGRAETEEEFMYRMKKRMFQRKYHVKKMCKHLELKHDNETYEPWSRRMPLPRPWFFVSEKHHLIYCEIPKSGCTNWKRVMMVLNGLAVDTADIKQGKAHAAKIGYVNTRPNSTVLQTYRESLRMMIVREPFERLTSAYWDKVAVKGSTNSSVFARFSYEVAAKYGKRGNEPIEEKGVYKLTVCKDNVAYLKCEKPNHVIRVRTAMFGRQDDTTCVEDLPRRVHDRTCSTKSARFIASQLCDGKSKCEVVASPQVFGIARNCGKLPNYLRVRYTCEDISSANKLTLCKGKVERLECPAGRRIRILSAFYGRKDVHTCSRHAKIATIKCSTETANAAVKAACEAKTSCVVEASPSWIQSDPCITTDKYLTIWYKCEVESPKEKRKPTENITSPSETEIAYAEHAISNFTRPKPPSIYRMPSTVYKKYGLHANFEEFVSYLTDPDNVVITKDTVDHGSDTMRQTSVRHWQNYHTLCYPCHIEYDVIAHMETIEEDTRYILNLIGAPKNLTYPGGYTASGRSSTTSSIVRDTFDRIEPSQIEKLAQLYETDYKLFQYPNLDLNRRGKT